MSATVTRTEVKVALPNPNTSVQPTPGHSLDPAADRVADLQLIQRHGYDAITGAIVSLGLTLEDEDKAALEVTQTLLADGGTQEALEAGADDYEGTLAHLTPTLGSVDLAALNAVLQDLRYLHTHLRTGDTLPPLPMAAPAASDEPQYEPTSHG
jgi:hypothetical protein